MYNYSPIPSAVLLVVCGTAQNNRPTYSHVSFYCVCTQIVIFTLLVRHKLIIRFSSAAAPDFSPARGNLYIKYIKYKYPARLEMFVFLKRLYVYIGEILKFTILCVCVIV